MKTKKLILIGLFFLTCLNLNAKQNEKKKEIIEAVHPMEYVLDLADVGDFKFLNNSWYGDAKQSTRQICLNFTKFVRRNKPQVGDTIRITGILISPIDIDTLIVGIVDDSVSADYWLNLGKDGFSINDQRKQPDFTVSNIKAGEPYNLDVTIPVKHKMKLRLTVQLAYGEQNGKPCKMQVQRLCDSFYGNIKQEGEN